MTNPRFVWYDLMTTDVQAAKAFYTKVLPWGTEAWQGSDKPYTMWTAKGTVIGGMMPLPAEAKGTPTHWIGYISTDDVDASSKRAAELGGKLFHPPTDIPEVGRFAVLADPQGAVFALFTPRGEPQPTPAKGTPGIMSWAELNTTDWEGAFKFYSALCGFKPTSSMDMGGGLGTYFMFTDSAGGEKSMGGMSNAANMMKAPAHWLFYTDVTDIDQTLDAVKQHGGKVLNGPMDVPGNGRIAQCMDPQGGFFAVYYEE